MGDMFNSVMENQYKEEGLVWHVWQLGCVRLQDNKKGTAGVGAHA